jgi:hypothetical protein
VVFVLNLLRNRISWVERQQALYSIKHLMNAGAGGRLMA